MTDPKTDPTVVTSVQRRRAKTGLEYSTNVIHHTSKSQTVFLAWYINHTNAEPGLAGKLVRRRGAPPYGPAQHWVDGESFSLDEEEVDALRRALEEHSAVAQEPGEGEILLIRGGGQVAATSTSAGPEEVVRAVRKLLQRPDVLQSLSREDLGAELISALQRSIRVQELRHAVAELRGHLDGGAVLEGVYQEWCTKHSWAFGNAHSTPDTIRQVSRTDSLDILLPRVLTGHRDIVELKRPDHHVVVHDKSHDSWYWSTDAAKAIGQCHQYMDHLHEDAKSGLRGRRDLIAYHPRATIVIGRSRAWDPVVHEALAGLNQRLNGITIMTYDQLLAQGEELLRVLDIQPDPVSTARESPP